MSGEEQLVEGEEDDNGIVLVACKDERSCMQLENCIMNGPQKVLLLLSDTFCYLNYVFCAHSAICSTTSGH